MLLAESLVWNNPTGWFACVALLLASVLVLLYGYTAYLDKEAVIGGGRIGGGRTAVGVVIILVIIALLCLLSFFWLFAVRDMESKPVAVPRNLEAVDSVTNFPEPIESTD
jgi:hypothetical protein